MVGYLASNQGKVFSRQELMERVWNYEGYVGDVRGVDVAVRPENVVFDPEGPLEGVLESLYYLGDVNDCRVRVGDTAVRVIAPGYSRGGLRTGERVRLGVREFMVFENDGSLEKMLEIRT